MLTRIIPGRLRLPTAGRSANLAQLINARGTPQHCPKSAIKQTLRRWSSTTSSEPVTEVRQQWMLRGAHENTFLSWTRNAMISTLLATQLQLSGCEDAANAALGVAGLCIGKGCGGFVFTAFRLRHAMAMTSGGLAWIMAYAGSKALLWATAVYALKQGHVSSLLATKAIVSGPGDSERHKIE